MSVLATLRWACLPALIWVVSGTLQAADPPFIVTAASAVPNPVEAKTTRVSVRADDDGGAANLTYTWTASGPSRVAFSPNRSNAAKDTTATFRAAGTYTLIATITDKKNQSVTSTVDVTVAVTPTTLSLSPTTVVMNPAAVQTFTATVRDQFAARIAAPPLVWSRIGGTGTDGATTATYKAGMASGSITATVTGTALTATSTITINAAPTVATPATAFAGPAALKQITLSALGADDAGEDKLAYTWSLLSSVPRSKATFSGAVQNTNAAKTITATVSGDATYTFRVRIRDAKGLYVYSQVTVVFPNRAPVVTPSPVLATTAEDSAVSVTPGVVDPDGDPLAWSVSSDPAHGTLSGLDGSTGAVTYTPGPDWDAGDAFTLAVSDGVNTVSVPVTVVVAPVNDAPLAQPLTRTGDEDALLAGQLAAADVDSTTLTWTATPVSHGTLALNAATGAFTYQPAADWSGVDGFQATVSDGALTSTVAVTLHVEAVNDAPVAQALTVSGDEDTTLAGQLVATDVDSSTLTWTATPVSHGTLVLNAATGAFTYQPAADWSGADGFQATVSDGVLTSTASVTIHVQAVNDAPVAQVLTVSGDEDTQLAGQLVATDVDSPVLTWTATGVAHGTLVLDAATGAFTYQPAADWSGDDGFQATVSDGVLTSTVAVTIRALAVNDAPVAQVLTVSGDEDTQLAGQLVATDVDSSTLTWMATPVSHGTLALDAATGSFTYQPAADWSGDDGFDATVSDGTLTSTVAVTIHVVAVNDAPVAQVLTVSGDEDTQLAGQLVATDVDSSTLAWTATPVSHGTLALDADTGAFTYQPAADWSGDDGFQATVSDGALTSTAMVTIHVLAVNDAPVLAAIESVPVWYRDGDAALALSATITASDPDSANLTSASVQISGNYQAGEDSLSFASQSGITGSWSAATGTLTLTGSATKAAYQAALRAVKYLDSSAYPITAARTISLSVSDGQATSAAVSRTVCLVTRSTPPWSESFDSYVAGADLHQLEQQGGTRWHAWDATAAATALVSPVQARSGGNAVAISGTTDLVCEYKGVSADGWRYTAWQYVPTAFTGQTYFILLNGYRDGGTKNWSTQVYFHGGTNKVHSDFDNAELPLIKGRWVELRVDIDLVNDRQRFFYDGVQLYEKSWTAGTTGGGTRNLAAVDLYANNSGPVYYDDLSLVRLTPSLSGSEASLAYTENEPAKPITATTVVSGFGIAQLTSATVAISSGFQAGEDLLAFTDAGGITGTWNAGTLTLSGNATPAAYQAALRSVTYWNNSENPSAAPRTISLTVSNGTESNTAQIALNVLPVDDPAVITVPAGGSVLPLSDLLLGGVAVSDVDSPLLLVSFAADTGSVRLPLAGGGASVGGDAATVAAALGEVVFRAPESPGTSIITVTANGTTASILVDVVAAPAPISVVPLAVTAWEAEAYHRRTWASGRTWYSNEHPDAQDGLRMMLSRPESVSGTGPRLSYNLMVTSPGLYHLWLRGSGSVEAAVVLDDADAGRVALPVAMGWNCRSAAGQVVTLDLAEGGHSLEFAWSQVGGMSLDAMMLVPVTPDAQVHDLPVLVGPGAVAVLDGADYDAVIEDSGYSWLPVGAHGVQAMPNIITVDTVGLTAGRGLGYDVFVSQPGTYRLWVLGQGGDNDDSLWFSVDGGPVIGMVQTFAAAAPLWSGVDLAGQAVQFTVDTPGHHRLGMHWREDGTSVHQIAISALEGWVPPEAGRPLPVSQRLGVAQQKADRTLIIEAEQPAQMVPGRYDHAWLPADIPGAVGGAMQALDDSGILLLANAANRARGASLVYYARFDSAGVYDLHIRGTASNQNGDSFHAGIAGVYDESIDITLWVSGPTLPWSWASYRTNGATPRLTVPAPGVYPIVIFMREDGAVMDRLLIQPTGRTRPTGEGAAASALVPPVSGPG